MGERHSGPVCRARGAALSEAEGSARIRRRAELVRENRAVSEVLEALTEGRAAFRACRWQDAYEALSEVDASSPLGAEDLEALGSSAWWICRLRECLAARERAFAAHLEAEHPRQAAMVALAMFFSSFRRGEAAIAAGWLAQGERLIEPEPERREHGRFLRARAVLAQAHGDLDGALESARRAAALGRRYEDRELVVLARYVEGGVLLKRGRVSEGMALLDEAMLAAIRGHLTPMAIGEIYCNLIDACYELGDLRRAGEWTEGLRRWSETQALSVYPGMCRVRRAGVLHRWGAWSEAEEEARRACDELLEMNPRVAAEGFYEIGEIRGRTGDLIGAEEAFRRASELGREPQPGLALVRLAQGNVDAAAAAISGALTEESWNRLGRAKLLPAQVEIAIAANDLETAVTAIDELTAIAGDYGSPALEAAAASARGALQLAQDDGTAALRTLRRAWQLWHALDCPFEAAVARRLLGLACRKGGDEEGAELALSAAHASFEKLGATLEAARTAELLGGGGRPAGLTEREVEVLRLVAAGKSNREIADELYISVKTVARHLSNIFFKLNVSSRTAATAFAYTHGILKGS
jgi:ATP/maltotriose-dependent transcriptional regulator MalT